MHSTCFIMNKSYLNICTLQQWLWVQSNWTYVSVYCLCDLILFWADCSVVAMFIWCMTLTQTFQLHSSHSWILLVPSYDNSLCDTIKPSTIEHSRIAWRHQGQSWDCTIELSKGYWTIPTNQSTSQCSVCSHHEDISTCFWWMDHSEHIQKRTHQSQTPVTS